MSEEPEQARGSAGRRRSHATGLRKRPVNVRFHEVEFEQLRRAAGLSGLTVTSYVAEAALAAATGTAPPSTSPLREALVELMQSRTQLRRLAVNVNQAAVIVNATGEAPVWLEQALALTTRAVKQVDDAAALVARRLP